MDLLKGLGLLAPSSRCRFCPNKLVKPAVAFALSVTGKRADVKGLAVLAVLWKENTKENTYYTYAQW